MAFSSTSLLKSYFIFLFFNISYASSLKGQKREGRSERTAYVSSPRFVDSAGFSPVIQKKNISYALKDSISLNQSITGYQNLTSEGGKFELGFFKPGKSMYYYLGIWYNRNFIPQQTVVWVANRETPLTEISKTTLAISENGNLVLSNQTNTSIWSTNVTYDTPTATVAVLLDTGNLVLKGASDPNLTLWQSFDHPTHTLLPGGKLGFNKVTKEVQRLISWKNEDDPAPGIFSHEGDPNGTSHTFSFWNNSIKYWTNDCWFGPFFYIVPEMDSVTIYNFEYSYSDEESYFTFNLMKDDLTSRIVMDLSGQIKLFTWVPNISWFQLFSEPNRQCEVHALCGPFGVCNEVAFQICKCIRGFSENSPSNWALSDWANGCVRNTKLECENDRFYMMPNTRMPDNPQRVEARNASDCEFNCLNDCSCTAYAYNSNRCLVWHDSLLHLQDGYSGPNGGSLFVRLAASEFPTENKIKIVIIASIASAILGFVVLLIIVIWLGCYYRKRTSGRQNVVEGSLIAFRYSELQRATRNFKEKLGGGGFGSVSKGVLPDSSSVAVKQLEGVRQGEKQFRTEVSTIGTIQHVNLVQFRGFCSEGQHKLLVYEYMPNGSLDQKLFNEVSLDWKIRYQIALGIARGLTYLHEKCRDRIVHCDIKPENILLDASFVPKIADFGLAKLIGRDFSRVLTTMRGTIGYLAPEWISGVAITAKADVYSYGMMLFEIVSGKRNIKKLQGQKISYFPSLAVSKMKEGDMMCLVDRKLEEEEISEEEVFRLCKVACWCIQDEEDCRPSMSQVIQMLEGVMEVSIPPIPRMLQMLADNSESTNFFSKFFQNAASSNNMTDRTIRFSTSSMD